MRAYTKICLALMIVGGFIGCGRHPNYRPTSEVEQIAKEWEEKVELMMTSMKANEVFDQLAFLQALHEGATNELREALEASIDAARLFLSNSVVRGESSRKEIAQSALDAIKEYEQKYGQLEGRRPVWAEEMMKPVEEITKQRDKIGLKGQSR